MASVIERTARVRATRLGGQLHRAGLPGAVRGHVDYEARETHRAFQIDLWNMGYAHATSLSVFVGQQRTGTMRVDEGGHCSFHRDTGHGQRVPILRAGNTVTIRSRDGADVARGTLHRTTA